MPVPKTGAGSGLIPTDISKRPDHKKLSAKGGKAKSKAKTRAVRITNYRSKKCKNCRGCGFKRQFLEEDPEHKCSFPDFLYEMEEVMTDPERLMDNIYFEAFNIKKLSKTAREKKLSFDALVTFKEQYFGKPKEELKIENEFIIPSALQELIDKRVKKK